MHRKNIFAKINSKNYKFSVFFLSEFLYWQCRNRNRNSMFRLDQVSSQVLTCQTSDQAPATTCTATPVV